MDISVFASLCIAHGLTEPVPEFEFAPPRKWRADWAWPEHKLLLEVEGGAWKMGRHNRPASFIREMEKYNAAAILGYRVLRVTPQQMASGEAILLVVQAMEKQP